MHEDNIAASSQARGMGAEYQTGRQVYDSLDPAPLTLQYKGEPSPVNTTSDVLGWIPSPSVVRASRVPQPLRSRVELMKRLST